MLCKLWEHDEKSVVLLSSYCPVLWGWSRRGSHESGQVARFMGHMNLDCRKSPVTLNRKLRMQEGCLRVSERTKIMKKMQRRAWTNGDGGVHGGDTSEE